MIRLETILNLIRPRMKRVLQFAEASLPGDRYPAFRKLVLDEFGRSGLETELERVFKEHDKDR